MNYAILLSGGRGERAKGILPKQYVRAGGHMMATYAIKPLMECTEIDAVYVVAEDEWCEAISSDAKSMGLDMKTLAGYARPGVNRQTSILNGMQEIILSASREPDNFLIGEDDTVLIHDAARPFLTVSLLYACYDALGEYDGVMPALPMKDTVYLSEDGLSVTDHIERRKLFAGQSPELFRFRPYYEANTSLLPDMIYRVSGASEPAIMAGMDIAMIPGDETNCKITTESDLERYIHNKESQ